VSSPTTPVLEGLYADNIIIDEETVQKQWKTKKKKPTMEAIRLT
jgi:hypothetical protein